MAVSISDTALPSLPPSLLSFPTCKISALSNEGTLCSAHLMPPSQTILVSASHRSIAFHCTPFFGINSHVFDTARIQRKKLRRQSQLQIRGVTAPNETIKWWERDLGVKLKDLHSEEELADALTHAEGKLVVVEFFATWCGSCKALYPKLCKLAGQHKDVVFLKVNFDESKPLCKSLNVRVLPYFHFYRGSPEKLDSFSCSVTKLQKLKDAISKYNNVVYSAGSAVQDVPTQ